MKVFISWSGELSKKVAELLNEWIPSVLQNAEPWISSEGIEKGEIWFGAISEKLADVSVGIVCLTKDNLSAPWILFEAGSLSKGLTKNRVCPLLIDLEPNDLTPPLSQFNATRSAKAEMLKLINTINTANKDKQLAEKSVQKAFERCWPEFQEPLMRILAEKPVSKAQEDRSPEDMINEILETVRAINHAVQSRLPESRSSSEDIAKWLTLYQSVSPQVPWSDFWTKFAESTVGGGKTVFMPKRRPKNPPGGSASPVPS